MYSSESTFLGIQQSSVACRGHWNSGRIKGEEEKKKSLGEEHPDHFFFAPHALGSRNLPSKRSSMSGIIVFIFA